MGLCVDLKVMGSFWRRAESDNIVGEHEFAQLRCGTISRLRDYLAWDLAGSHTSIDGMVVRYRGCLCERRVSFCACTQQCRMVEADAVDRRMGISGDGL